MGRASRQQLENAFGTHKDVDVVMQILEKGQLIPTSIKDRNSVMNDSKSNHNQTSQGSQGGFGGR